MSITIDLPPDTMKFVEEQAVVYNVGVEDCVSLLINEMATNQTAQAAPERVNRVWQLNEHALEAMKELQKAREGEAEKAGFYSDDDVAEWITKMRREGWPE